jgi:hypothetical protein
VSCVSRADWLLVLLIILGIVLFLYGANYYNNVAGWFGVFLFVGSIVGWIIVYVYRWLGSRKVQKP